MSPASRLRKITACWCRQWRCHGRHSSVKLFLTLRHSPELLFEKTSFCFTCSLTLTHTNTNTTTLSTHIFSCRWSTNLPSLEIHFYHQGRHAQLAFCESKKEIWRQSKSNYATSWHARVCLVCVGVSDGNGEGVKWYRKGNSETGNFLWFKHSSLTMSCPATFSPARSCLMQQAGHDLSSDR